MLNLKNLSLHSFIILIVILVCLNFLTVKVYGNVNFSDLNKDNVYYNSVMELVNDGVVSGYSDGTFKPDKDILVCEAITIVEKVFGNSEYLPEWSKWDELSNTKCIYKTDWNLNSVLFFNNYLGNVDYEIAGHLVFASNDTELMCPEMYDYSSQFPNMSNLLLRGYVTNKSGRDIISRGEFCDLVVWAKYNINNVPEYSKKIPIKYSLIGYDDIEKEKVTESYVLGAFVQCPGWLLNYFNSKNGFVKIIAYDKWDIENFKYAAAVYYHSNVKPTIELSGADYGVALHELGHFVWYADSIKLPKGLFDRESMYLVNVMNDNYCKTNEIEYFAEAFSACFTHPVLMQKKCPETYIFIKDICDILEEKYK